MNWPRDGVPGWNPHTSYHASGQHHHKAFNWVGHKRRDQRPDEEFKGETNVVTFGIASGEPQAVNVLCNGSDYSAVFEIPSSQLGPTRYSTMVSVNLVKAGERAIVTPDAHVRQTAVYDDALPWIVVAFFDTTRSA